mgnify:CR=1 FL=1
MNEKPVVVESTPCVKCGHNPCRCPAQQGGPVQSAVFILAALLLMPVQALSQTKPLAPGTYTVKPCPAPIVCPACPEPAPCPVVEQPVCPAATVLPQPAPLCVPVCADVDPFAADAPGLVAPAPAKAHLKPWHKIAINFGIGSVVGAIMQHQWEDDDGGDTHKKKVIVYPPPDDEPCGSKHPHDCP